MVELILEVTRKTTDSAGTVESLWQGIFPMSELQQAIMLHNTAVQTGASEARLYARNENHQHLAIVCKLDVDRAIAAQNRQVTQPQGILIPLGGFDPNNPRMI